MLVPVKSFSEAKRRLAPALEPPLRQELARRMAENVLAAARPLLTAVVCDDPTVADWARGQGALVIWEPGRGLNGAVEHGVRRLAGLGTEQVIVAHADLPWASGLSAIGPFDGVTLVPDRHGDGTNVVSLPPTVPFRFHYGPGSFARHLAQCQTTGLSHRVLQVPDLAYDVDVPADLIEELIDQLLDHSGLRLGTKPPQAERPLTA